ncbi:hypothetical protein AX15_005358 [Amanita polypyramis BW_CC]|nr:hypothetical protein AX15_005358 [Amanita polypyramis BW_CC]
MDGELCFMGEGDGQEKLERAEIVKTMDSKVRATFEELRNLMSSLATWEMESVLTGSPEVMATVRTLGEFSWTYCDAQDCDTITKHVIEREKVCEMVRGHGAQDPLWSLPGEGRNGETLQRLITRRVTRSAAASRSSEYRSPMNDTSRNCKRDHEEATKIGMTRLRKVGQVLQCFHHHHHRVHHGHRSMGLLQRIKARNPSETTRPTKI